MNFILDSQAAETNRVFGKTNTFLLNTVLALFHRGYLGSYDRQFVITTKETLEIVATTGFTYENSITRTNQILSAIIEDLLVLDEPPTPEWLEIRLKPLKIDHPTYIDVIINEFNKVGEMSYKEIKERYLIYRGMCDRYKEGYLVKQLAREIFGSVLNSEETGAMDAIHQAMERITPLLDKKASKGPLSIPGISSFVMSDDETALQSEFKEAAQTVDTRSVLKSGYKGWDMQMSDYGGMLRGTVAELQAISGGGKSDTARVFLNGVARHTTPFMFDSNKKPCLIYLTLEDTIARSITRVLTQARREELERFDVPEVSEDEATKLYREMVEVNGYTVFNIKGKQKELTPRQVIQMLEAIMDDGYEIHLLVMDYMGLLSYGDIDEANHSEQIKTGYSYLFNFCQENLIAAILCAQIAGREYSKVIDSAENDGLRRMVHENISSQSMNIINVIDIRIMVHVVKGSSRAFHIFTTGKNRVGTGLSESEKYCVYELHRAMDTRDGVVKPAGYIKPDHYTEAKYLKRIPTGIGLDDDDDIVLF